MSCCDRVNRIALVGLGSQFDEGDFVGVRVVRKVRELAENRRIPEDCEIRVFEAGNAPENITGEIRKYRPAHLVIVDAAVDEGKAVPLRIIRQEEIGGFSFSTHSLPLGIFVDYCEKSTGCGSLVIGVDPGVTGIFRLAERVLDLCLGMSCCGRDGKGHGV